MKVDLVHKSRVVLGKQVLGDAQNEASFNTLIKMPQNNILNSHVVVAKGNLIHQSIYFIEGVLTMLVTFVHLTCYLL